MKKIGLVLAGGGGRGAYQIGVWKALREKGLDKYITSVSGASVGGLNAALFIQNDLEAAQYVWESISMKKILTPKFESNSGSGRRSLFERDGLKQIIDDNLDKRCFDNSERNCWMPCVRRGNPRKQIEEIRHTTHTGEKVTSKYIYNHIEYFNLKYFDDDTKRDILLGTSAIPLIFPKEEIGGHPYVDGGARLYGGDNVPVRPLYDIDKCNIILIIHLTSMDKPVNRKEFPEAALFEIFPKKDLGSLFDANGMLDFTSEGAKKRIEQGYNDNYDLFARIKENINAEQNLLNILSEAYEEERQHRMDKKELQDEILRQMKEYERT